jgi:uncharacterized membrane protein
LPQEERFSPPGLRKPMPITCPQCHAEMPDNVAFCPGCGRRMWVPGQETSKPAPRAPARPPDVNTLAASPSTATISSQPKDNLIAALAYVTFLPAVVFVLFEPFKRNRFIRFHAYQSIFLTVATILIAIAIRILYSVLTVIPVVGYLLAWLVIPVALLGWGILWVVLVVKALQGEALKLPLIGNLAEKA